MGLRDLMCRRPPLAGRVGRAISALVLVAGSLAGAVPASAQPSLEGTTAPLTSALTATTSGIATTQTAARLDSGAALAAGRSSRPSTELEVTAQQVTLQIDSLGPELLTGSEDLVITGTIANGTEEEVAGTVVVQMQRATDMTVTALGSWLTGARNGYLATLASVRLSHPVGPGQTGTFTVDVSRANLPLAATSQWGPRGLQVQLVSGNDTLARARSVVVWDAGVSVDPTRVTLVVPVAATPTELTALTRLRDATLAGQGTPEVSGTSQESVDADSQVRQAALTRVTGLLSLTQPGVVLAVDPAFLTTLAQTAEPDATSEPAPDTSAGSASTQASSDEGRFATASPVPTAPEAATGTATSATAATSAPEVTEVIKAAAGSAPERADLTDLLAALRGAVRSGRVITLPWHDADLTALTDLDASNLVTSALTRSLDSASSSLWTALQPTPAEATGTEATTPPTANTTSSATASASPGASTQAPAQEQGVSPSPDHGEGTETSRQAASNAPGSATYLTGGPLDGQTLATLPDWVTSVIADPWDLPVAEDLTYTPSGLTSIDGRTVIVPDPQLSGTIAGTIPTLDAPTAAPGSRSEVIGGMTELTTRQMLRAESAILTRQAPNLGRDVIVSVSRLTAGNLDPQKLGERIEALTASSWTTAQDLSTLLAGAVQTAEQSGQTGEAGSGGWAARSPLPDAVDPVGALSASQLNQASVESSLLVSTGSVAADPAALVGDPDSRLLAATAVSWRTDPDGRQVFLTTGRSLRAALAHKLTVLPSSTINVISDSADLPVRLHSELGVDVSVTVHLDPSNTRLQADGDVRVTVPAGGEVAVTVPTRAVGSGDVEVAVRLLADDGTQVGTLTSLRTRVRADWESVGTRVVAGLLALMLAAGIWRTVRRGRRSEPETLSTGPVEPDCPAEMSDSAEPTGPALQAEASDAVGSNRSAHPTGPARAGATGLTLSAPHPPDGSQHAHDSDTIGPGERRRRTTQPAAPRHISRIHHLTQPA